jgi:hypothetical protein
MVTFGGLNVEQLGAKLISMGYDGNSMFQGIKIGVTTQMKENVTPFMMGIHCFVHRINLVVLVLSKMSLVVQLEVILHVIYGFFSIHLKNSLNFKACVMCLHRK